jgi:acyl-coenzyme A thioesterase PaaI-like protein
MIQGAFQDYYSEQFSHCYGCGRLNDRGLQIKTYWDGDETVSTYVYGGLIASLIDCHSTGTAAAAAYRAAGRNMDTEPILRFLTASLHVDYLRPTPIDKPIEIRGWVEEIKGRKVVVKSSLSVDGEICARGEVIAVQVPEDLIDPDSATDEK